MLVSSSPCASAIFDPLRGANPAHAVRMMPNRALSCQVGARSTGETGSHMSESGQSPAALAPREARGASRPKRRDIRVLVVLATFALVAAACGGRMSEDSIRAELRADGAGAGGAATA